MIRQYFVLLLSFLVCSCASIFNSGGQMVVLNPSIDREILVEIRSQSGDYKTKIPSSIYESSGATDLIVSVKQKCYKESEIIVNKSITPSFWANFLWGLGFPLAMLIDYGSGKMWKYENHVIVPVEELPHQQNIKC